MGGNELSKGEYAVLNLSPAIPMVSSDLLDISGSQAPYFRTNSFSEVMYQNESNLLDLIGCNGGRAIFLTSSGTGAMDAVVGNLIRPKDKVLVVNGGSFGQRWLNICQFYGLNVYDFKVDFGKRINMSELEEKISSESPRVVLTQHVETSSGQRHDVEKIGEICRQNGSYLIVDAISSFANEPYNMEKSNADATIISSQKGMGLSPGTSVVVLGKESLSRPLKGRNFYFDFDKYLGTSGDMVLPFTPNVASLLQWNHQLKKIREDGMESKVSRVKKQAEHFRSLITGLPLRVVADDPANCVTALYTEREDLKQFFIEMQDKGIYFSPQGGKGFQMVVTHMGDVHEEDNIKFVGELQKWLMKK